MDASNGVRMDSKKAHYVVATAIVVKDGKFLIAKRAPREVAFPNKWTVPGGKLQMDDYVNRPRSSPTAPQWYNILEDLVRREVMEETGLTVKNVRYLASLTFIRPDGIPVLVVSLFADHAGGDVTLCPDLTEHAWVSAEEARQYDLIDGIQEELEMVDRHLKGEALGEWKKNE